MIDRDKIKQSEINKLNELPIYILHELYSNSTFDYLVLKCGKIVDVKEY